MKELILLLTPSRGLGGGIERFVHTIEAAFQAEDLRYRRIDLLSPDGPRGLSARLAFVREVVSTVRSSPERIRLVIAHRNLATVVHLAALFPAFGGATVILHGNEIWMGRRLRGRRTLRRPDVRTVAVSNFSAGALASACHVSVLHPGLSRQWYDQLVQAGLSAQSEQDTVDVMTTFRLADWRDKGLDVLLQAIDLLADNRVTLTVCGTGPVPADLANVVAAYPRCAVVSDLDDSALAARLAAADMFVLSTRTRGGSAAYGEGFGLVLLEAQVAGTPVIAPAYGGSADAFQPEVTGLSPIDESPEALAETMAVLVNDPGRRTEMGRAAAMWARSRFEPSAYGRRAVRILVPQAPRPVSGLPKESIMS